MSKSKVAKKSSVTEVKGDVDVLLVEFTKSLQLDDDFVWIENTPSVPCDDQDHLDSSREINTCIVNIAQPDINTASGGTAEECSQDLIGVPPEREKELLEDQHYWEQNGTLPQRDSSSRTKYPASQRLTVTELNKIAMHKTASRDPSYYKLNISTTAILNSLIDKKIVKSYHNVLGNGNSSVVIHAHYPQTYDTHGMAIKVYKLSNDVKKNNAMLKRSRREYEHLLILKYCSVPQMSHRLKNVIVFRFMGKDQEPFPALSSIPSEYCTSVYQILVEEIKTWYIKYSIVHGKLCTKSILYDTTVYPSWYGFDKVPCRPCIIGWGHSVKRDHPLALKKLMRDCHFITEFFSRRGVLAKTTTELFKDVTGLEEVSSKVLDVVRKRDLWQEGLLTNPNRA